MKENMEEIDVLNFEGWMYLMYTDEEKEYIVISEEKLDLEDHTIEGLHIDLEDCSEVSKFLKIGIKKPLILVNSFEKRRVEIETTEQLFRLVDKLKITEETFFKYLLSYNGLYFRNPRYFERFLGAFLLSSKQGTSSYPLHLMIVGPTGSGKSKILESIDDKMQEVKPITEGAGCTMKSLIPSFKGNVPRPGDLISASRVCFVDEFLRILMRVEREERENKLTFLNPLLEHKERRFASGNSEFNGKMTAKMMSVTNPIWGISQMKYLANKFDNSFLGRLLIWYQDNEHVKFIKELSRNEEKIEKGFHIDKHDWISIYDYFNSFTSKWDNQTVDELFSKYLNYIPQETQEIRGIYTSRYQHHIRCLLDGLIKLRCLFERNKNFNAKKEDYDSLEEIWRKMIENWGIDIIER